MNWPAPDESVAEERARGLTLNVALAAAGGCMDAFTYVGHGHVFANAMTGNVVLLAIHLASGNWRQALRHIPPIVTFLIGVAAARALGASRVRQAFTVLLAEIVLFLGLSFLPDSAPDLFVVRDFFVVTVMCFAASLQTATFRQVGVSSYNSTFTTGNLRTLSESFFDWIFRGNRPAALAQTIDFAAICSAFFAGAVLGGLLTPRIHNKTLWLVSALLAGVLLRLVLPAKAPTRPDTASLSD